MPRVKKQADLPDAFAPEYTLKDSWLAKPGSIKGSQVDQVSALTTTSFLLRCRCLLSRNTLAQACALMIVWSASLMSTGLMLDTQRVQS